MRTVPTDTMPALEAQLVGGGIWRLAAEHARTLELIAVYRGLHSAQCRGWLAELHALLPEFEQRGIAVIALSCDPHERAERAQAEWGLPELAIGSGLEHEDARKAGLYLSEGRGPNPATGIEEPRVFAEPAVLAVQPDGTLYAAWVQSGPYARPRWSEVLAALDRAIARGLPEPRGAA